MWLDAKRQNIPSLTLFMAFVSASSTASPLLFSIPFYDFALMISWPFTFFRARLVGLTTLSYTTLHSPTLHYTLLYYSILLHYSTFSYTVRSYSLHSLLIYKPALVDSIEIRSMIISAGRKIVNLILHWRIDGQLGYAQPVCRFFFGGGIRTKFLDLQQIKLWSMKEEVGTYQRAKNF